MFDLKAKLLAKGLVTKEQVEKASIKTEEKKNTKDNTYFVGKEREKALNTLRSQSKSEQYTTIRKWVDLNRLDKASHISIDCEKFFLNINDNQVTWLTLKKKVIEEIKLGNAAIIAYMSNHGFTHAVVPRDIAEDVGVFFPDWVKILNDKN
jgi:uncharacterized protein YaiL (DUF2058 family)